MRINRAASAGSEPTTRTTWSVEDFGIRQDPPDPGGNFGKGRQIDLAGGQLPGQ